jgi:predicted PurR-regulated permease PerM
MRFRLRTLLILLAVLPPMLAATWWIFGVTAFVFGVPVAAVLWDWLWDRIEWQRRNQ